MLRLIDIKKVYEMGETKVEALKGVSLNFRKNEFVSILGPSGCGKTTLLNIIGGLDRYTTGDLIINGVSTKEYKDKDWDTYRNHSIGFVFQSYNLIPHQTVLENVELALTLSGVSKEERRKRAIGVLEKVGLKDKIKNKPSQLSGGQMQRVAIARALVNDPEIILADEPTGALDTVSSVQIMEILKEIAKDKLIIMVTHNPDLAKEYSTRIVKLLDGNLIDDSNPYTKDEEIKEIEDSKKEVKDEETTNKPKKKRMSFFTALALSFKNLLTKKARTILVAFAGSIGIIGIALILSISSGFSTYVNKQQEDTLSNYPLTINAKSVDFSSLMLAMFTNDNETKNPNHNLDGVYHKDTISSIMDSVGSNLNANDLKKFRKYIIENYDEIKDYVNAVQYTYNMNLEFYKDNEMNSIADIDNVQPNSNALMKMIVKYSLFYFEKQSGAKVETTTIYGQPVYTISRTDSTDRTYSFVRKYPSLSFIETDLEDDSKGNKTTLDSAKVVELAFTLMGFDSKTIMGSGSNSYSSNMMKLTIFYEMIDNETLIKDQYDLLAGDYTLEDGNALLVLDKNNEVDELVLYALGIFSDEDIDNVLRNLVYGNKYTKKIDYNDIIGVEYKVLEESDYIVFDNTINKYVDFRIYNQAKITVEDTEENNPLYDITKYYACYMNAIKNTNNKVKITGVVRLNNKTDSGSLSNGGIAYTKNLTKQMLDYHNTKYNLAKDTLDSSAASFEYVDELTPESVQIYVNSFEAKSHVKAFIDKYNETAESGDEISYTDYVGLIMSTVSTIINAITYVLVAFVSVSLVVSSIMIGIITYISVIERTKEIGILRSVGASKKDVKRVFTAESFIIGLASGTFGITITLLLILPINIILKHFTGLASMAYLPIMGSVILIAISIVLTLIAGLIPAQVAAKKDPVVALRTE